MFSVTGCPSTRTERNSNYGSAERRAEDSWVEETQHKESQVDGGWDQEVGLIKKKWIKVTKVVHTRVKSS